MRIGEGTGFRPEGWEGTRVVEDIHIESIFEVIIAHEAKNIIVDIAEEVNLSSHSLVYCTTPTFQSLLF